MTRSIPIALTILAVLAFHTPSVADDKRLGVRLDFSTAFDECLVNPTHRVFEMFLATTTEVLTFLKIDTRECDNLLTPVRAEAGSALAGDLADFSLSQGSTVGDNGNVTVVDASGTFTVYNHIGVPRNVPFNLRWTAGAPLRKWSGLTQAYIPGGGYVLLDAKFSSASASVTGVIDGWLVTGQALGTTISTVP